MADIAKIMSEMAAKLRAAGYSEKEIQIAKEEYADALPGKVKQAARQALDRAMDARVTRGKSEQHRALEIKRNQLAGTLEGLKPPPGAGHARVNKSMRERKKVLEQAREIEREMDKIDKELNPPPKKPGVIMPDSYYRAMNRDD